MSEPPPKNPRPKQPQGDGEKKGKLSLPFLLMTFILVLLVVQVVQDQRSPKRSQTELWGDLRAEKVDEIQLSGTTAHVWLRAPEEGKPRTQYRVEMAGPEVERLLTEVSKQNETAAASGGAIKAINYGRDDSSSMLGPMLIWLLPVAAIVLVFWLLMRKMGPPQGVMNFGKSRAKVYAEKEVHVTFADVAGCDEAVEEVREIVEFLKEPKKFQALGARIPKGVLLLGAPGTGKTLLARAVAGEAGVPFFSLSGSDFVEMFVGVGASRVRDLFQQAEQQAPCLVFVDELDALGKTRGTSPVSNDEREQTLNALLVEMDGFSPNNGVIVIAATNRPEILDPALRRPGRFDRQIVVDRPDLEGRRKILAVHARKVRLDPTVDMEKVARRTPGFVGADLANVINEAALLAARRDRKAVGTDEFEEAIDRVVMGLKRQNRAMTQKDKETTAAHEAGHAVAAHFTPGAHPVHKITIIPRGMAGGVTWAFPENDQLFATRDQLMAHIVFAFGGRVAEKIVYDETSTGAANDLEQLTRIARAMVTRYGMSERLGPVSLESETGGFLRDPFSRSDRDHAEDTQRLIDEEVRAIVLEGERRATAILTEKRHLLDRLRAALVEKETVDRDEFLRLMSDSPAMPAPAPQAAPV
ncbi:MAG: ATP-dependent zinc metalloprotease FtsH [Planctomycetes bacterium]|nr:ATP-dependent zinc metalloprotease FtsH [Planctomycetota bacterium]